MTLHFCYLDSIPEKRKNIFTVSAVVNEFQKMEKKDVFQLNASALLHATNDNTFGEYKIPNTATGIIDSYQVMSMQ